MLKKKKKLNVYLRSNLHGSLVILTGILSIVNLLTSVVMLVKIYLALSSTHLYPTIQFN
jgi:hypothetical protein